MSLVGKTILVVEDEPLLREAIAEELQYIGMNVFEADGGI